MVVQNQKGIPFIGTHAGTPSHWLIGAEFDSVNATHMLPPPCSTLACSLSPLHKTARTPLHHAHPLLLSLCTCCCEQQDPSVCFCSSLAFPLLSPLHPSIPFFHVCSAVKPSWIRPASLVTCSLCWCGNKQRKTTDRKPAKPVSFAEPFMSM